MCGSEREGVCGSEKGEEGCVEVRRERRGVWK